MHEAKKIIVTGLIISLGVIIEEYIDGFIKASVILEPFSDILTSVFIGAITGITVSIVIYHIDKNKNDKDAIEMLREDTKKAYANIDRLLGN